MSEPPAPREAPGGPAPPEADPGGPVIDESAVEWRRVHKITPVLNVWKVLAALVGFGIYQNVEVLTELWQRRDTVDWGLVLLLGGAGFVLLALLLVGYSALAWWRMRYAIGRDAIYLHSGILFRQQRHARLNRIQAVDVVRPLLGRIFGLSRLRVETAGGGGSVVDLAFLRDDEAQRLRREVLAHIKESRPTNHTGASTDGTATAAGSGDDTGPETDPVDATAAAAPEEMHVGADRPDAGHDSPERPVHAVPTGRLLASLVRSGSLIAFVLLVVALVVTALLIGSAAPMLGAVPGIFIWGAGLWSLFSTGFNFRSTVSVDGIRLRHGLLEQRTQTLPPGRVHAVELKQPLLWRRKGWWRVSVNVAGYVGGDGIGTTFSANVLLPVGERGEALTALWLVMPDLGVPDARAIIDAALEGQGPGAGFLTSPRAARWLDPISRRRNGLLVTDRGLIMRGGRLTRWASFIPHERTQSLAISRGPLQRALGLTSFQVAGVGGPVSLEARHLEPAAVLGAFDTAAALALGARRQESATQWFERMDLLTAPAAPGPAPPQPPPPAPWDRMPAPPPPRPAPGDRMWPPPAPGDRMLPPPVPGDRVPGGSCGVPPPDHGGPAPGGLEQ